LGSTTLKRRRLVIAVVAAVVAAGSIILLVSYVSGQRVTVSAPAGASVATSKVVVATSDLAAGARLTPTNVGTADYPVAALPPGGPGLYFTDVRKLLAPAQYTATRLPKGTVILSTLVVADPVPATTQPPIDIPHAGDVAISIPFSESTGAGGFVQPEDHIDILVDDASGNVHYAFQDVRVIKVGGKAEQGSTSANLLLIELPREEAAALAYAEDKQFAIRYAVRPRDEFGAGTLPNSSPVTGSNWTGFLNG